MRLSDKCQCGSELEVRSLSKQQAIAAWVGWLNAHSACRGDDNVYDMVEYPKEKEAKIDYGRPSAVPSDLS